MVDTGTLCKAVLLEDPVDLLLFAPHEVPVITISLLPLSIIECSVYAVAKGSLKFDILAD